ncbi:unnamed protein product [Vitrella brassicaformis CCMP3155]|uniref:Uncharacterized protein n=1 Tax=Vitrella brassicaformis (strain CCMP3155) TaxID=1169540 RepID=A0A0G4E885_VITBC|nr:unnamed protein product [Vitrella brassicaformis CCMP3155]|eukprot:CEL91810.1 unnamed protein product [Vitrella brassicaformis CCMP3155]
MSALFLSAVLWGVAVTKSHRQHRLVVPSFVHLPSLAGGGTPRPQGVLFPAVQQQPLVPLSSRKGTALNAWQLPPCLQPLTGHLLDAAKAAAMSSAIVNHAVLCALLGMAMGTGAAERDHWWIMRGDQAGATLLFGIAVSMIHLCWVFGTNMAKWSTTVIFPPSFFCVQFVGWASYLSAAILWGRASPVIWRVLTDLLDPSKSWERAVAPQPDPVAAELERLKSAKAG